MIEPAWWWQGVGLGREAAGEHINVQQLANAAMAFTSGLQSDDSVLAALAMAVGR